jgi:TatA/E family protein of Tat protein translocase
MEGLGFPEILLIAVVILIFFGPKKIPEIAQGLGKGIREFRNSMKDVRTEIERVSDPVLDREQELMRREADLKRREQELEAKSAAPKSLPPDPNV